MVELIADSLENLCDEDGYTLMGKLSNLLMKKQPDGNVIGFQSADIAFTAEHPVAWTLDGEFGGDMETVRVCNRPRAIRIMRG